MDNALENWNTEWGSELPNGPVAIVCEMGTWGVIADVQTLFCSVASVDETPPSRHLAFTAAMKVSCFSDRDSYILMTFFPHLG